MDKNNMKNRKKSILIGMCLGDGYICTQKSGNKYHSSLRISHTINQKEFITYKRNLLHSLLGGKLPKIVEFNNNGYTGLKFSKGSKYFRVLRKWLYVNKNKKITRFLLNKLTIEAIAIWWMDDGSMYKKKNPKTKKVKAIEGILSTYISKKDNQIIINYFKDVWNIEFKIVKNKNTYRLRLNTKECRKLAFLLRPYIIPSMKYKIDVNN